MMGEVRKGAGRDNFGGKLRASSAPWTSGPMPAREPRRGLKEGIAMLLRGGRRNRIGAAVALAAVLVMVLAAPAGASGWGWGEEKIWSGGFFQHVLTWLGLAPSPGVATKTDQGSIIDPNGCPSMHKLLGKQGSIIDPNGGKARSLTPSETMHREPALDPSRRF